MSNISNRHRVVQVITGPIGAKGDIGASGSSQPFSEVSNGNWSTANNIQITGSLTVSGSNTFTNIGSTILSGSVSISGSATATSFIGNGSQLTNLPGQLSIAALNAFTSSVVTTASLNNITGSFTTTSSFNSFTSSYKTDSASFDTRITNITTGTGFVTSATFTTYTSSVNTRFSGIEALTSSISALNDITSSFDTRLDAIEALTSSISALNNITSSLLTISRYEIDSGSINDTFDAVTTSVSTLSSDFTTYSAATDLSLDALFTLSTTQDENIVSLTSATASYVTNSQTASFVTNAQTSSMTVLSSSYAATASYALNAPVIDTTIFVTTSSFNVFTGSIQTQVNNLTNNTSSYVTNSQTSSMLAPYVLTSVTASMSVLSSSFAATASFAPSYVLNSATSSFVTNAQTSSFVTNSQTASMSVATASLALRASGSLTGSLLGTATTASYVLNAISSSYAATASYINSLYASNHTASFTNQSTWTITHNLNTRYVIVQTFDINHNQIIPQEITLTNSNTVTVIFPQVESGYSVITVGGALLNTQPPAGNANTIQYNNGGAFGGSDLFTFDGTSVEISDAGNQPFISSNNRTLYTPTGRIALASGDDLYMNSEVNVYKLHRRSYPEDFTGNGTAAGDLFQYDTWNAGTYNDFDVIYLESNNAWFTIDQSDVTTARQMLGINLSGRILTEGYITISDRSGDDVPWVDGILVTGAPVYIKEHDASAPYMSTTVPTTGIVRILGHLMYNNVNVNTHLWMMKFRPDHTWVQI
jgi:hypothetical protein